MSFTTLEHYWHPIATADEVGEQPAQFVLLGERIVAWRDEKGVVAFKDLCIHRGAALSGGRVANGVIACPYHGWQYNREGQCVHIPALPEGTPIPKRAAAIPFPVREAYGLVWVALAEPTQPFPEWPDNAWDNPQYRVFLVGTYRWRTSAGRAVENAMDFAHFNFVHKGYTELADGPVIKPHDVFSTDYGLNYAYEDGRLRRDYSLYFPFLLHDKKTLIATNSQSRSWSDRGDSKAGDTTILTFIAQPISEIDTRLYSFIGRNHALDRPDSDFATGFDEIMEQDRVVVESQRPEQIPDSIKEELHLRYPDGASIEYRRLFDKVRRQQAEAFRP